MLSRRGLIEASRRRHLPEPQELVSNIDVPRTFPSFVKCSRRNFQSRTRTVVEHKVSQLARIIVQLDQRGGAEFAWRVRSRSPRTRSLVVYGSELRWTSKLTNPLSGSRHAFGGADGFDNPGVAPADQSIFKGMLAVPLTTQVVSKSALQNRAPGTAFGQREQAQ